MKNILFLVIFFTINPFFGYAQSTENLDYISPYHNGYAAIKKNNQWAFINAKGDVVINYRTDLNLSTFEKDSYPIFSDDRCLIEQKKNGISYFGYIDTAGNTVIEPQFLNATHFNNESALALEVKKETVAQNKALDKNIVYYRYYEVVIGINGEIVHYLNPEGVNVVLDKEYLREPPKITSHHLSKELIAVKGKNGKWALKKLN